MPRSESEIIAALLAAYREGVFPMADPRTGRMEWFSPDPRALMPLNPETTRGAGDGFHISRSLARRLRSGRFVLTTDTSFEEVVRACAEPRPDHDETWIDERIVRWYTMLHTHGHAHSIEAWFPSQPTPRMSESASESPDGGRQLVGGIYGVSIGAAFFAESMFSRPALGGTDASKVCLAHLVAHLRRRGFTMMDVQFRNPHIDQFGVYTVRRHKYMKMLNEAAEKQVEWESFEPELHFPG